MAVSSKSVASAHRDVAIWLLVCCVMVAVMVLLGGLTRLTHSGLSMVEWEPIIGIIPPINDTDWLPFFEKYKLSPEYIKVNAGMTLDEFKGIFWLEYIHRAWGRLIGLVFLFPFLWLVFSRRIGKRMIPRLAGLFAVGAAQGGMGWIMVASGLVDNPAVSHVRLTAHLALAFLVHGWMFWIALDILAEHRPHPEPMGHVIPNPADRNRSPGPQSPGARAGVQTNMFASEARGIRLAVMGWLIALTGLVVVTVLFGGLVAGLKAGLIYNTWPLMDGRLIPDDLFPGGLSHMVEDIKTVQFTHRCLAELTVVVAIFGWFRVRSAELPISVHAVAAMAAAQMVLGIGTLILAVPVWLASLHQMGAMILLTLCLWALHDLRERMRCL